MKKNSSDRMDHVTIIADNGGGLTLQIDDGKRRWQHTYSGAVPSKWDGCDIAQDIANYIVGGDLSDYEGDEQDEYGWLEPTDEDQRNGGYRVLSVGDVLDVDVNHASGWCNVQDLKERLCRVVLEGQHPDDLLAAAVRNRVELN